MTSFILLLLFLTSSSFAEELTHSGHTLYVDNHEQWEVGKDLFGIPFILFSPQTNGQRSNISFAHTGAELSLEVEALKSNQKDYQANKKKWAELHSATIKKFIPYSSFLNAHGHRVHSIGVSYENEQKIYIEKSFYTECKDQILFSKSLRLQENSAHEKYFSSLINSLDCGIL
ncbi:MAG TPA: hypothetical protein VKZ84_06965 [Bacteriovoracaceae bacterium]|nr:hypothetical protein [Bacteriovoracaceae bacterium]